MAHNEQLTVRVREALLHLKNVEEKRAFRGIIFMLNGKMCVSTGNDELLCRIDPALHDTVMEMNGTREMSHGRTIRGYIFVHEEVIKDKKDFDYWINLCLAYNPHAKASKPKPKKSNALKGGKIIKAKSTGKAKSTTKSTSATKSLDRRSPDEGGKTRKPKPKA
jgi:hypothetical protein